MKNSRLLGEVGDPADFAEATNALGHVMAESAAGAIYARRQVAATLARVADEVGVSLDADLGLLALLPDRLLHEQLGKARAAFTAAYRAAVEALIVGPAVAAYVRRRDQLHPATVLDADGGIESGGFTAALARGDAGARVQRARAAGDARLVAALAAQEPVVRERLFAAAETREPAATPARAWEKFGPALRGAVAETMRWQAPVMVGSAVLTLWANTRENEARPETAEPESEADRISRAYARLIADAERLRVRAARAGLLWMSARLTEATASLRRQEQPPAPDEPAEVLPDLAPAEPAPEPVAALPAPDKPAPARRRAKMKV